MDKSNKRSLRSQLAYVRIGLYYFVSVYRRSICYVTLMAGASEWLREGHHVPGYISRSSEVPPRLPELK